MIQTYKDLKGRSWDKPGIPKWIFRAGNDSLENLHPDIVNVYNTQLKENPEYELFYFSREDKLQFITDQNNEDLLYAYNTIAAEAFKTDIFRYVVLNLYGGVYMDFSMQTLVSLDYIIKDNQCVFVKDNAAHGGIYNAFIVSNKSNSFLERAIERCIYNIKNKIYGRNPLAITSPDMLGDLFKALFGIQEIPLGQFNKDIVFYNHKDPNKFIVDELGRTIINIKHPNHYKILYTSNRRYDDIWERGQMFGEEGVEVKTYKDIKGRKWTEGGIPKWIFKTGPIAYDDLPIEIKKIHYQILRDNPGYEMFYFSDEDCVQFISDEYGETHLKEYNAFIPTAYKADYWRYCVLNTYGGCYGDFTQIPYKSYDEYTKHVDRVLVRDDASGSKGNLYNAFMCIKAGDPILKRCLDIIKYNISVRYFGKTPLDITGPTVLGQAFKQLKYNKFDMLFDIVLGDYKKSRIYIHDGQDRYIRDKDRNIIALTKTPDVHNLILYTRNNNKHYHMAWHDGQVYA